jgi:hypothetical protein
MRVDTANAFSPWGKTGPAGDSQASCAITPFAARWHSHNSCLDIAWLAALQGQLDQRDAGIGPVVVSILAQSRVSLHKFPPFVGV